MSKAIILIVFIIFIGSVLYFIPALIGFALPGNGIQLGKSNRSSSGGVIYFFDEIGGALTQAEFENGEADIDIFDIEFSPDNEVGYSATDKGVYVSNDGGKTWYQWVDLEKKLQPPITVYKIIVDRQNPDTLYLSTFKDSRASIYSSNDKLYTVNKIYDSSDKIIANDIELRGNTLYLGMSNGEVLLYDINDRTYRGLGTLQDSITDLVVKNNGVIYAATKKKGTYARFNASNGWQYLTDQKLMKTSGAKKIYGFGSQDRIASTLYAASAYGLLKTDNYGKSWTLLNTVLPQNSEIAHVLVTDSGTIYAAKKGTLYKSQDDGTSWSIQSLDDDTREISALENYNGGETIFVGTRAR